jgi:hypothetical protein
MRYKIIAIKGTDGIGGLAENAVEALLKLIQLERIGRADIIIKDESDRVVTRAELFAAVEKEKNADRG